MHEFLALIPHLHHSPLALHQLLLQRLDLILHPLGHLLQRVLLSLLLVLLLRVECPQLFNEEVALLKIITMLLVLALFILESCVELIFQLGEFNFVVFLELLVFLYKMFGLASVLGYFIFC